MIVTMFMERGEFPEGGDEYRVVRVTVQSGLCMCRPYEKVIGAAR